MSGVNHLITTIKSIASLWLWFWSHTRLSGKIVWAALSSRWRCCCSICRVEWSVGDRLRDFKLLAVSSRVWVRVRIWGMVVAGYRVRTVLVLGLMVKIKVKIRINFGFYFFRCRKKSHGLRSTRCHPSMCIFWLDCRRRVGPTLSSRTQ